MAVRERERESNTLVNKTAEILCSYINAPKFKNAIIRGEIAENNNCHNVANNIRDRLFV